MITYKGVEPSKLTVFDLLRLTAKQTLCFKEINQRVARDVAITARVLKLANARSGKANLVITSISQAVIYLGEDTIRQFVRVLAISELGIEKPTELTKLALTRAQFMSLVLDQNNKELSEQGYLVGLFSVLDSILDADLKDIVKEFALDAAMSDALLHESGILGECLTLTKEFEVVNIDTAMIQLAKINPELGVGDIFNFLLDAILYSDDIIEAIAE
ncbi:hypothetical protein P20652_0424 [Pseudoalteromonas sp. BSi20652]|nr:hypothetical protein P20652_0424 [Pseudoalteromonas sp. BSi20652]